MNYYDKREQPETKKGFDMDSTKLMKLSSCINKVFKEVDTFGFTQEVKERIAADRDVICRKFDIGETAAVLLCAIVDQNWSMPDEEDLAKYLGCSNIEFLSFQDDIQILLKKGIIVKNGRRSGGSFFTLSSDALKCITKDIDFVPVSLDGLTADQLFTRLRREFSMFFDNCLPTDRLDENITYLLTNNAHIPFCQKLLDDNILRLIDYERLIFIYLCHRFVSHGEKEANISRLLKFVEEDEYNLDEDIQRVQKHILLEKLEIQEAGLVTFGCDNGMANNERLALSDKCLDYFEGIELIPETAARERDMIYAKDIVKKNLFFNKSESEQLLRLRNLLDEKNFNSIRKRLEEKGMRRGFNAIFYGAPGTGKTAGAYELARQTGRDIYAVDMSCIKNKFVGESEKNIKKVFRTYRHLVQRSKTTPILLFNEADAIFSKRLDNIEASVDMMNNSIQNIILDELESLDGIMIATTNMEGNLDPAFERRFIFKIEFRIPEAASRAKIWRSMMDELSEEDAGKLAEEYKFSGGNIENIARKSTVEYILSGEKPCYETVEKLCEEEQFRKNTARKVGF